MKEREVKLWNGRRRGREQGGCGKGGREGGTNLVLIGFDVRLHGKHQVGITEHVFAGVLPGLRLVEAFNIPVPCFLTIGLCV